MRFIALAMAGMFFLAAEPAFAQVVKDKKSCLRAVEDVRGAREDSGTTGKSLAEADDLVRIAEHLCTQGNFVYANTLLELARGMLANE